MVGSFELPLHTFIRITFPYNDSYWIVSGIRERAKQKKRDKHKASRLWSESIVSSVYYITPQCGDHTAVFHFAFIAPASISWIIVSK